MTDHKTVREALKIGQDLAKKEVNRYVQNGWDAAPAIIDKKNICEALAALDRIEAVETVTDEKIAELADFYVGRFYDPSDGCYTPEKERNRQCKLERKDLRRWIEVLAMNGLRIVKEK